MNVLKVCNIFCQEEEDLEALKFYLKDFPVYLSLDPEVLEEKIPSLIVSWDYVKKNYPTQNIFDKKIYEKNIGWAFSQKEEKKKFLEDIKNFVNDEIINWLPSNFEIYDPFFEGSIESYVKKKIDLKVNTFVYFYNGALYVSNSGRNHSFNIKSLLYASQEYKKNITNFLNLDNVICFSYKNIRDVVSLYDLKNPSFESIYWSKFGLEIDETKQFNIIPDFDYQKYIPFFMNFMGVPELDAEENSFALRMVKRDQVTEYCSTQKIAVKKDLKIKGKKFEVFDNFNLTTVNFSNKRTLTNRIVARDVWNIQNEKKLSERKGKVISRFKGGKVMVCDYQSFETWISIYLTRNLKFINSLKGKDIHSEVGKVLFKKQDLKTEERSFAKLINHAMLYGASYNKLVEMISEKGIEEPREMLYYVQEFLKPVIENSKTVNEGVKKSGYTITPWGSIVRPDKSFAAYNNLIQTSASEMVVDKIFEIKSMLEGRESEFLFQVHDSLVFDISPREVKTMYDILNVLSVFRKNYFPVTYSIGDDYLNLSDEKVYLEK